MVTLDDGAPDRGWFAPQDPPVPRPRGALPVPPTTPVAPTWTVDPFPPAPAGGRGRIGAHRSLLRPDRARLRSSLRVGLRLGRRPRRGPPRARLLPRSARWWTLLVPFAVVFAAVALLAPSLLPGVNFLLLAAIWVVLTRPAPVARALERDSGAGAVLVDLRERVLDRTQLPALPPGWSVDIDLRSAYGGTFGGDFVLTARSVPPGPLNLLEPPGGRLDLVLVDVSGSGPVAGGRALLLAGALEALLDAVPRDAFMAAANEHLLRRGDEEGFATAVHVGLDLATGRYELVGAGHPPAVHYRAGAGRWEVLDDGEQGPALGLMGGPAFPVRRGVLARGDALLLYTDGLVESRELDVGRGIDRLLGHADTLLLRGGPGPAARIAEAIRAQDGDDRALVVIRRT